MEYLKQVQINLAKRKARREKRVSSNRLNAYYIIRSSK